MFFVPNIFSSRSWFDWNNTISFIIFQWFYSRQNLGASIHWINNFLEAFILVFDDFFVRNLRLGLNHMAFVETALALHFGEKLAIIFKNYVKLRFIWATFWRFVVSMPIHVLLSWRGTANFTWFMVEGLHFFNDEKLFSALVFLGIIEKIIDDMRILVAIWIAQRVL